MNVTVGKDLQAWIEAQVESGAYANATEVVERGLRLLRAREEDLEAARDEVRRKIQAGIDQLDRGESVDGEVVFARIRERNRLRRAAIEKPGD